MRSHIQHYHFDLIRYRGQYQANASIDPIYSHHKTFVGDVRESIGELMSNHLTKAESINMPAAQCGID